ncbi:MAG TPA: hypothetical protein VMN79_04995 [Casimicrobiaceae bacterium]|nr:hypothetical protein [Casimicrobiaceae bacterium]
MIDAALLSFAITMVASPPQYPPKAVRKPVASVSKLQQDQRFADFAKNVLKCYHPTARYQGAAIEHRPWAKQKQYGAKGSALVSIEYLGVSNAHYTLVVGVLAKPEAIKTVIASDTAVVKAYENCELADWVDVK